MSLRKSTVVPGLTFRKTELRLMMMMLIMMVVVVVVVVVVVH